MSSTNRGGQRSEADFYPTPAWTVARLLERFHPPGGLWLEPCAGDGAIIRAVRAHQQKEPPLWTADPILWTAIELRSNVPALQQALGPADQLAVGQDFLAATFCADAHFDVAITNPPYSHAQAVIDRCLQLARAVVMGPMRLAFLASEERRAWWGRVGIPDVYVLPNRPSFVGGKTDSCEYAWFVWRPGERRSAGSMRVLAPTPRDARRSAG